MIEKQDLRLCPLEDHLRRFVRTDAEIEEELNELLGAVAQGGAG